MFRKDDHEIFELMVLATQIGLTMAGSIGLCLAVGILLDRWLNTKGLFITIFILLGIGGGGWTVYRQIMKAYDPDNPGK